MKTLEEIIDDLQKYMLKHPRIRKVVIENEDTTIRIHNVEKTNKEEEN